MMTSGRYVVSGEARRQAERLEQRRGEESADVLDAIRTERQHLEVERVDPAVLAAHVEPECGLPVRPGRHQPHVVPAAWTLRVDEPADVLVALVPAGVRRHLPD